MDRLLCTHRLGSEGDLLKDHLMEELDYALLPKAAWEKLVSWYGLTPGSREICRYVQERKGMDGWMGRWVDGRMDGRMDRQTDRQSGLVHLYR